MRLGYNTNGFAHHELGDAVRVLGDLGYQSVALTIDHHALSPRWCGPAEWRKIRELLAEYGMTSVVETGARFLLDPWQKHEPTLLSADPAGRARRIAFYQYAIDLAAALGSDCVSLWSGVLREAVPREEALDRLAGGLREVLDRAAGQGVALGFEPEPGMFIETMEQFAELQARLDHPALRLTLDVGHLHCLGEVPIADQICRWGACLINVHVEDMRRGRHEHLMFGEGQIDFPPVLRALDEVGYRGGLHVELSRHSHDAPAAARRARDFLRQVAQP